MSKKKQAKRIRRDLLERFDDWLGGLDPEQLARAHVTANVFKPSFRVVLEKAQNGSEGR